MVPNRNNGLFLISTLLAVFVWTAAAKAFPSLSRSLNFVATTSEGRCSGKISYPEIAGGENDPSFSEINAAVKNFAAGFFVCKPISRGNQVSKYRTTYELLGAEGKHLTVKWVTKLGAQTVRLDCLNFDIA